MKESNPILEEIIKALNHWIECANGIGSIEPYRYKNSNISFEHILDLIHRLQSENERLTEEIKAFTKGAPKMDFTAIEMLECEKKRAETLLNDANIIHNELLKERNEAWEKNAELRKQVEELKKENTRLDKNVKWFQEKIENGELVSEQAVKDTAKEIFTEIFESCVFSFKGNEDYKKGFCDALEQYDKQLRDLAKQNGVGVE